MACLKESSGTVVNLDSLGVQKGLGLAFWGVGFWGEVLRFPKFLEGKNWEFCLSYSSLQGPLCHDAGFCFRKRRMHDPEP